MRHIANIFSVLLTVLTAASGEVFGQDLGTGGLQEAAEAIAADQTFGHAYVGICVMDDSGRVLAQVNADRMMVPASNMKLLTTGAALHMLGPSYRFETTLAHDGIVEMRQLHPWLSLVRKTEIRTVVRLMQMTLQQFRRSIWWLISHSSQNLRQ